LEASPLSDANGDGVVDIQDMTLIASNWLATNSGGGGGGASFTDDGDSVVSSAGPTDGVSPAAVLVSLPAAAPIATSAEPAGGEAPIANVAAPLVASAIAPTVLPTPLLPAVTQTTSPRAPSPTSIVDGGKIELPEGNSPRSAWLFAPAVDEALATGET